MPAAGAPAAAPTRGGAAAHAQHARVRSTLRCPAALPQRHARPPPPATLAPPPRGVHCHGVRPGQSAEQILNSPEFRLPHEIEEERGDAPPPPPPPKPARKARAPRPPPAPRAPPAAAAPPADGELDFVPGACYGCGARIQLRDPSAPGYVEEAKYAPKAAHKQLDQLLCGRCGALSHGRLVNAVAGQGSAPAAAAAPNLVNPERLRDHLPALRTRKTLVVLLVDATDFSGSFLPRLRDAIGANPVLLVVTKADLLPYGADTVALAEWIEAEVGYRRLTLVGLHLVSSRRGDGMRAAVAAMASLRAGRDVAVVGAANVGKSSFIRAALAAMRAGGDVAAPGKRLPLASAMPGTTLGVIPLRAFRGEGVLYDTPGVVLHHRINGMLDAADLAALTPRGPLRPREARVMPGPHLAGCAFFWEALVRVDVLEAPRGSRLLFFGPDGMRVGAVTIDDAEAGVTPWDGGDEEEEEEEEDAQRMEDMEQAADAAFADDDDGNDGVDEALSGKQLRQLRRRRGEPVGAAAVLTRGGLRMVREVDMTAGSRLAPLADIAISGLGGWVTLVAGGARRGEGVQRCLLRVWAPRGAEVFVRPPMPVFPHGSW